MGEFLHRSRPGNESSRNLHQSHKSQLNVVDQSLLQKTEAKSEAELGKDSSSLHTMQMKWDISEGGEENNKSKGRIGAMMEEEEGELIQRKGPLPLQLYAAEGEERPVQRKGSIQAMAMKDEEEQPIQRSGPIPLQFYAIETEEAPVQRKGPLPPMSSDTIDQSENEQSSSGKMPFLVQRKMESSFGEDFSDVNIHTNSSQSKELKAHAFAKGKDIHFAPGAYNPESQKGQELLGHELTHVVQQREGRVQPTVQKKGVGINDDEGLEKEADEMGEKAVEGQNKFPDVTSSATNSGDTPNPGNDENNNEAEIVVGVKDNRPFGSKVDIAKIQTSLKTLGYYSGAGDGFITRKDGRESETVKAVRSFQKEHHLPETGNVDRSTNAIINNLVGEITNGKVKDSSVNGELDKDGKALEAFFVKYENFARIELNHWYAQNDEIPKDKRIDASYFSKEARKVYNEKKDLSYVVPVQYALAQLKLEGGLLGKQRSAANVFNVYAYDTGVSKEEAKIDSVEKGFSAYYNLMSNRFLTDKGADPLLEDGKFRNKDGGVYATNPFYEIEIKSEIGSMYYRASDYKLSSSVGDGGTNKPGDVKIVGSLLNKAGYLDADKMEDERAVVTAILNFQKRELAPTEEKWFKDRMKEVKDKKDQESIENKTKSLTDGLISTNGQTIGLLYFNTVLNNKIPDLSFERDREKLESADKKESSSKKETVSKEDIKKQTEVPSFKSEETKLHTASPRKFPMPQDLFEKYKKGTIDILALGKGLKPHGPLNGKLILQVFDQVDYMERDNLAYVITSASSDSLLSAFNKDLLARMADYLSGYFNTLSWEENSVQAARIYKIIKPAKADDENNGNGKQVNSAADSKGSWAGKKFVISDAKAMVRNENMEALKDASGKAMLIPKGTEVVVAATKVVSGNGYIFAQGFGWTSRTNVEGHMANETFGSEKAKYDSTETKHKTVGNANSVLRKPGPKYEEIKGSKIKQGDYVIIKEESQDSEPKGMFVRVCSVIKNSNGKFTEGGLLGWTAKSNLVDGWADFKSYNAEWEKGNYIGQTDVINVAGTEGIEQISSKTLDQFFILKNAAQLDGIDLKIGDGFRRYSKQEKLWNANPDPKRVAKPGKSNHQHGQALDLNTGGFDTKTYNWMKINGPEYGWIRTVNLEHWHWEYRPADAKKYGFKLPNINV